MENVLISIAEITGTVVGQSLGLMASPEAWIIGSLTLWQIYKHQRIISKLLIFFAAIIIHQIISSIIRVHIADGEFINNGFLIAPALVQLSLYRNSTPWI